MGVNFIGCVKCMALKRGNGRPGLICVVREQLLKVSKMIKT